MAAPSSLPGWPHAEPPFHAGERALQAHAGMADRLAEVGSRVMRAEMPEQHRELFGKLPFMLLGALDADGRPWATMLAGAPGFVSTPDARSLQVAARPLGEGSLPALGLEAGDPVGLLGLEPSTRRRNRVNGVVAAASPDALRVEVRQSFGNCPKYIQARSFEAVAAAAGPALRFGSRLPGHARAIVERADTFFIATASADAGRPSQAPSGGLDVSHRGGAPGFVRTDSPDAGDRLLVPDYIGNFFFNTLGNIVQTGRAGLLFVDWPSGGLLALTARARVLVDGPLVGLHRGAQRLVELHVEEGAWLPGAMPWRSAGQPEYAPQLTALGGWTGG